MPGLCGSGRAAQRPSDGQSRSATSDAHWHARPEVDGEAGPAGRAGPPEWAAGWGGASDAPIRRAEQPEPSPAWPPPTAAVLRSPSSVGALLAMQITAPAELSTRFLMAIRGSDEGGELKVVDKPS